MARPSATVVTPVLLSLGSNLGDRLAQLDAAVRSIRADGLLCSMRCSPVYETEPVGYHNQPRFLNCCIAGLTSLDPFVLHSHLKDLERRLGRRPRPRWHEREIDIDIILYGDNVIEHPQLVIPHPQTIERAFVLIPASDIVPSWIHPQAQQTIAALADTVRDQPVCRTNFCITC
ncbi:MAG: 2-amino-4-hydroxy-6-hydroxymethyldihydropteridine diphosphokinase [Candidatus Kapaibacterium sp.]|nr:MAG: 2-amino-4-hydroxy-6-hydroxymethyldihydropteridine diphosphokinase [Candidatus Kapabacteria bacterium]